MSTSEPKLTRKDRSQGRTLKGSNSRAVFRDEILPATRGKERAALRNAFSGFADGDLEKKCDYFWRTRANRGE